MSRLALFVLLFLCVSLVSGEIIVNDLYGNEVGLPLTGGNATGGYTVTDSHVVTSPYHLYVTITDETEPGQVLPNTESFFVYTGPGAYCQATLINQTFQATTLVNNMPVPNGPVRVGTYTGSETDPNTAQGIYIFTWTIPVGERVCANITYTSTHPNDIDRIYVSVTNPNLTAITPPPPGGGIVGDPQFVGLRGQSYQVHGIDGAVYNIISEKNTQVNSRFTFLSQGQCPIFNGIPDTNCWSHPGSYLGEISFQEVVDGVNHQALITAGSAKQGFSSVTVDGKTLKVGASVVYGVFSLNYTSTHSVSISTEHFSFQLSNSDMFINQDVSASVPLKQLTSHGLLGQTHSLKIYPNAVRYIEGNVDDYIIDDDDIFGTGFVYNQFSA